MARITLTISALVVLGFVGAAHAYRNAPPDGSGPDIGNGPAPYAGPTYGGTAVPRPGDTVEFYRPTATTK